LLYDGQHFICVKNGIIRLVPSQVIFNIISLEYLIFLNVSGEYFQ